jgi:hypothetical protein
MLFGISEYGLESREILTEMVRTGIAYCPEQERGENRRGEEQGSGGSCSLMFKL